MPPARGSSRHGSNTILKAASEPSDSIKTRTIDVPSTPPPQHDRPPSPSPPPRHLMELFPPLPGAIYVHCLQRHAYLVETLSQPSCVHSILETNRHQVLAHVVMEILDASSSDIAIASLTLPPTLRFVLQLLILHEQRVWPNETPTPDLVVGLCGILVLLWRVTARVDALLAHVDTTNGVEEALPLDEINANLKLRLALLTEEWAHAIGVVVRDSFHAVVAEKAITGNGGTPLTNSNHAAFMTKLLQELLRPMGNFLLSVDDDNARRYVLTQLLDKTIDTTIELVDLGDACIYDAIAHEGVILLGVLTSCREVVASVARVTEADRRQLQANIDHLKAWIDATCDRLSTLPSVKRLDRLNQEWNILGIDNRRRRSSFDIIMDTLTSDTMARFYRGKQHQQHSVASMSRISSKMVRTPTGKK